MMRILAVSDKVDPALYGHAIKQHVGDIDLILGCGDLPRYYLEYLVTMLGGPLFYVIGNHANAVGKRYRAQAEWEYPAGCVNIDGQIVRYNGLLIAGLEGSMRYNNNRYFQYTEQEMARKVWGLGPRLVLNRFLYGRYLDILITHAPPEGIHDKEDRCHQGFRAFVTFMNRFRPRYLLHGHVHVYSPLETTETLYGQTHVVNVYGRKVLELEIEEDGIR
jgi:Icc-related predicted phosphoesterase